MTKKKRTLYIMLPIVILVWGYVFLQFFSFFSSAPNYAVETTEATVDIDNIETDTFSIVANYRDPFLGKNQIIKNKYTNTKSATRTRKINTNKVIVGGTNWPAIVYKGMIKNKKSKARVGIISMSGVEHIIKEGQTIKDIKIEKIDKDLITVRFGNEKKTIQK